MNKRRILGFVFIATAIIISVSNFSINGAFIGALPVSLFSFIAIVLFIGGVGLLMAGGSLDDKLSYKTEPNLSKELKKRLISTGNYERFLRDYSNLHHNFMPQKLKMVSRGEKYRKKQDLSKSEKRQLDTLGKNYADTISQLLELGILLDKDKKDYVLIGGFGVLGNMVSHNPKFVSKFRGTEDIDILSKDNISSYFRKIGYRMIPPEKVDLSSIPDKRLDTYIKENPHTNNPLKIQDRKTIALSGINSTDSVMKNKKQIKLYGIPLWVADPESLTRSKQIGRTRKDKLGSLKDLYDIKQLELIEKLEE